MSETPKEEVADGSPGEGEPKLSKNQLKKLAKKKRRAEEKAAKRAANEAAQKQQQGQSSSADVSHLVGVLPLIKSSHNLLDAANRQVYTEVGQLTEALVDSEVLVRARVQEIRGQGNMCFLELRKGHTSVQAVAFKSDALPKAAVKFIQGITKESIVDLRAKVAVPKEPITSCSVSGLELQIITCFIVSKAGALPIQVSDCSVPDHVYAAQDEAVAAIQAKIDGLPADAPEEQKEALLKEKDAAVVFARVGQFQRLNNRVIDLRTQANNAIFRIQSAVCGLFREFLTGKGFVEIHSPKLLGGASEGGAEVFKVGYFETEAFLAQSPQLYKQMCIAADFGAVFEVAPVFRAENSHTHRHLCEFMGMDLEMEFKEHYHEVLDVIENVFVFIFTELPKRFARELEAINKQFAFKPLRFREKTLRLKWPEAIAILRENGVEIGDLEDIDTTTEKLLGRLIAEKYEVDFYAIDKFPANIRPFYTMLDAEDPNYTNSYDLFVRGEEITSGAQRIHDPEMLTERSIVKEMDPESIKSYIDSFRYGCPPHAGCGVGLERLVMLYLGLPNIRRSSLFPRDPSRLTP